MPELTHDNGHIPGTLCLIEDLSLFLSSQHSAHLCTIHRVAVKLEIFRVRSPEVAGGVVDQGEWDVVPPEHGEEGQHANHSLPAKAQQQKILVSLHGINIFGSCKG